MNDKQQLAAIGEHMAEQAGQEQPLCMAKRIEELEAQVRVMVDLLTDLRPDIELHLHNSTVMKSVRGINRCKYRIARIDAALAGKLPAPATPAVPEGWQLVPVEPTHDMLHVIIHCDNFDVVEPGMTGKYYRAMLAAAPKPEAK